MCGRAYSTYSDEELHFRYLNNKSWPWNFDPSIPSFAPNYNLCPTQSALVLSVSGGILGFRKMRWGLVPAWAKSVKDADKYSMINAKSEEISAKRSYKSAFEKRRCIVPVSGFYEWKRGDKKKVPFAVHLKDSPVMSLAGIWEHWENKAGEGTDADGRDGAQSVDSFCLLTAPANALMQNIHHRMPVILDDNQLTKWLDPAITDPQKACALIESFSPAAMSAYEVSTLVNSPRNNTPQVLEAVR